MRILVVEDEKPIAEVLRIFLKEMFPEAEVLVVHTVASALRELERTWDVCICDCILPDGTACEILKQKVAVPVVVTTGYVDTEKILEVKERNPNLVAVLKKPYTLDSLAEVVEEVLKG